MAAAVSDTSLTASRTIATVGTDMDHLAGEIVPQIQALLGEMSSLTASLHRLSEQSARDPRGLLFGRAPGVPGPGDSSVAR